MQVESLSLILRDFVNAAFAAAHDKLPLAARGRAHFSSFITCELLRALYQGAQEVFYPKFCQGVGFAGIEAQAAGVPASFRPVGSLADLVGPLMLLEPSSDIAALCESMDKVSILGLLRAGLDLAAKERVQQPSWRRNHEAQVYTHRRVLDAA